MYIICLWGDLWMQNGHITDKMALLGYLSSMLS